MSNLLTYWFRAKISKWSIDELINAIQQLAWKWAKRNYDKATKKLQTSVEQLKQLEPYACVAIFAAQAQAYRKAFWQQTVLGSAILMVEGVLTYGAIKYYYFEGRALEDLSNPELFLLFGLSFVITCLSTLFFGYVISELNRKYILNILNEFNIPEKKPAESAIGKFIIGVLGLIAMVVSILLAYFRVKNTVGDDADGLSILFSVALQLGVAIGSAYAFFRSYCSRLVYTAWEQKQKFERLLNSYIQAKKIRFDLKERFSDQAATRFMSLMRFVRALLKYPPEKVTTNPKTYGELREFIWSEFQKTLKAEADNQVSYERPACPPPKTTLVSTDKGRNSTPIQNQSNEVKNVWRSFLNFFFFFLLVFTLSSCDFLKEKTDATDEQKSTSGTGKKVVFVRVLLDVSGTTSQQRWQQYKKGIYEIFLNLKGNGSMVVYSIDEASYAEPVRMITVDFRNNDFGDNNQIRQVIDRLPNELKPPFNPKGDFERPELIFKNRVKPFADKIWPLLDSELDSVAATRKDFAKRTDILGALQNLHQDYAEGAVVKEKNIIFGSDIQIERWLFVFSDLIQHSADGIKFARPFGITREETRTLLNNLNANNKIPALPEVKVVLIGRGMVSGGPVSNDGIGNIVFFWREYFKEAKADVVHIGSTDDRADIARIFSKK